MYGKGILLISFVLLLSLSGNILAKDLNPPEVQKSREEKDKDWETVVKMTMIARDLMVGNKKLEEMGYGEEALGSFPNFHR